MVMTMCLSILARVLLGSKDIFVQVIGELARDIGGDTTEESVLAQIIVVWVNGMSSVSQPERLKLMSLALCTLLSANSPPIVFQQFANIISKIVETLNDITKIDDTGCIIE